MKLRKSCAHVYLVVNVSSPGWGFISTIHGGIPLHDLQITKAYIRIFTGEKMHVKIFIGVQAVPEPQLLHQGGGELVCAPTEARWSGRKSEIWESQRNARINPHRSPKLRGRKKEMSGFGGPELSLYLE